MELNNRISIQPMIADWEQLPDGETVEFYLVPLIGGSIICRRAHGHHNSEGYLEPICWLDPGQKLSSIKLQEFLNE